MSDLDVHFCRGGTDVSSAADFYPTVKAALHHESVDLEEDRSGLGFHLGHILCRSITEICFTLHDFCSTVMLCNEVVCIKRISDSNLSIELLVCKLEFLRPILFFYSKVVKTLQIMRKSHLDVRVFVDL